MTERTADAVEADYHATINLLVLLSYWHREHPLSGVEYHVRELKDVLARQLVRAIEDLTDLADTELCEEEAEGAWQDFLRILKEHRETKEPDAEDEPEPDGENEGVGQASPFDWTIEDMKQAARAVAEAGFSFGDHLPITREESSENQATEEGQAEHERKREAWSLGVDPSPPSPSKRIAALEEWREVTDERVTMLEDQCDPLPPRLVKLGMDTEQAIGDMGRRLDELREEIHKEEYDRRLETSNLREMVRRRARGESLGESGHHQGTPAPAGLQPGPPTEPGLYLVAYESAPGHGIPKRLDWGLCELIDSDRRILVVEDPGGEVEVQPQSVTSHLKLPKDPAEGMPIRTGWKADAPPADARGLFLVQGREGWAMTFNHRNNSENRIEVVLPTSAANVWSVNDILCWLALEVECPT